MFLAYLLAIIVVIVTWYHRKYARRTELLSKIPAIKSYPLVGSNLSFIGKSASGIFNTFIKASEEFGNLWRIDLTPFQTNIVISDPKLMETVLSSQKLLEKSLEYDFVRQWLGEGW